MFSLLAAEDYEQKIDRSFELPAGGTIELANINGEIDDHHHRRRRPSTSRP